MLWPSHQLYGGELIAHDLVKSHLLREVKEISDDQNTSIPLLFIDTAGSGMQEMENEDVSKGNEHEVQLVEAHVDTLVKAGVNIEDIGVITPYNLQVIVVVLQGDPAFKERHFKKVRHRNFLKSLIS